MTRGPSARRRRPRALIGISALVVVAFVACEPAPPVTPGPSASAALVAPEPSVSAGPPPEPGHELYGFVPYWEMDEGIVAHLADTPLSTIGLFSVTHDAAGALRTTASGYQRITGDVGRQIIEGAHKRGQRVELVYTSFGQARNRRLLRRESLQNAVIASLVATVGDLKLDGVNVDIEALDPDLIVAYGGFVGRLRDALVAADPGDQVSVATGANILGATMAAGANQAGADRIFLMAYDYRTGASSPGATSPLDRRDGDEKDLPWSLDLYASLGVPPGKLLLGLPLYGVTWPVVGPDIGASETGRGEAWILRNHLDLLRDPKAVPQRDEIESVEVYALGSDGSVGPPLTASPDAPPSGAPSASPASAPSPSPSATARPAKSARPSTSPAAVTWNAVYVDSPETLATKLELARERGLAGSGFWAIGYERGLPAYTELMRRFATDEPLS